MTRWTAGGLAAIVAVSFSVAFAVGLASPPRDQRPQTTVVRVPAGGALVSDRGGLRPVAALPALRVPPAPVEGVTPTPVVAAAPAPVAPSPVAPPPVAPAVPAPAPAPVAPAPPAPQPPERGPVFDSEG